MRADGVLQSQITRIRVLQGHSAKHHVTYFVMHLVRGVDVVDPGLLRMAGIYRRFAYNGISATDSIHFNSVRRR